MKKLTKESTREFTREFTKAQQKRLKLLVDLQREASQKLNEFISYLKDEYQADKTWQISLEGFAKEEKGIKSK